MCVVFLLSQSIDPDDNNGGLWHVVKAILATNLI